MRDAVHTAAIAAVRHGTPLDALLTRSEQRHLVRVVRDRYLDDFGAAASRGSTCVVVTAGPAGAGKTMSLVNAVDDLSSRLVIDADIAKRYLAEWCVERDRYEDLLATVLPDSTLLRGLELGPLLHTMSVEACNLVRRTALADGMDVVIEGTMASVAYGQRLLRSLARADYRRLHIVSAETDRETAHERAVSRWWDERNAEPSMGGRLVLPETIDRAYSAGPRQSVCRANARALADEIRGGSTTLEHVTIAEIDDGRLVRLDADPPQAVGTAAPPATC